MILTSWPKAAGSAGLYPSSQPEHRFLGISTEYLAAIGITVVCTVASYPLYQRFDSDNIIMVYLLGTTLGALRLRRGPCILLPVANNLAFDFFYVPPVYSLGVEDAKYAFSLFVMLVVSLVIAHLMVSIRRHRDVTTAREHRTAVLYAMSRELTVATDVKSMTAAAVKHIGAVFHSDIAVLLADENGSLNPADGVLPSAAPVQFDPATVREVQARGERVSDGAVYLPLQGDRCVEGVIIVKPRPPHGEMPTEQLNLLDAFAAQLAVSLHRARIAAAAEFARIAAERALLRNTLLASISHDLRTPLAAIAGAGSMIAQPDYAINTDRRTMLGSLIERKAGEMTQLLSNVLDLAKMELGNGVLRSDWHAIDDLVSHSLRAHEVRLTGRRVTVDLPPDLPAVLVESTLIVQILSNLIENAAKYTPPGAAIGISASIREGHVQLVVCDDGPGLPGDPERLFEKFQRGTAEGNIVGVGLGLAICRAAARLHGGDIHAVAQPGGGARFEINLPVAMQTDPPVMIDQDLARRTA